MQKHKIAKKNLKAAVNSKIAWKSVLNSDGLTRRKKVFPGSRTKDKALPGSKGGGNYYHILLKPKEDFDLFRYHDIGRPGHIQRRAGKRPSGVWETQAWLISKNDAHVEDEHIIPDTYDAIKLLRSLGSVPQYIRGDIFEAKERLGPSSRTHKKEIDKRSKPLQTWWINS